LKDWRNRIFLSGDKDRSESFIGPAQSQMEILKSEMQLRGLSQAVRQVWLHEDVYVECRVCFNQFACHIWTPPIPKLIEEELEQEVAYLLVVTGNETRKLLLSNVSGVFEPGEQIECGDDGYGTISTIADGSASLLQTLYGSFIHCFEGILTGLTSLATGTIDSCYRRHFADLYEHRELIDLAMEEADDKYNIFSALDNTPASEIAYTNTDITIRREWTKVYDSFTVGTFAYVDRSGTGMEVWGATASFEGQAISWDGGSFYGPFIREVRRNVYEVITRQGINTHIGWDVWTTEDDEGNVDYYCGLIGDQEETLRIFRLDQSNLAMIETVTYESQVRMEKYFVHDGQNWHMKYGRILGYGYIQADDEHVVYWGRPGRSDPYYYKEIINTGEIIEYDLSDLQATSPGELVTALWNPIKRELYVIVDSLTGPSTLGLAGELTVEFRAVRMAHPSAGIICHWYMDGTINYNYSISWSCADRDEGFDSSPCTIYTSDSGIEYEQPAYCAHRPEGMPNTYFFGTRWGCTLHLPQVATYQGRMLIDGKRYYKGNVVLYTVKHGSAYIGAGSVGEGCCLAGETEATFSSSTGECRPYSVRRYDFQKWLWVNDLKGLTYELLRDSQKQTDPDASGDISCVWEDDWETLQEGNTTILKAADDSFPYDTGWTSILLSGQDRNENDWSGSVIYKDLAGDEGYFMVAQNMKHYPIGQYDRCFFHLHTEEEVTNG
jgi:hypothetical protein